MRDYTLKKKGLFFARLCFRENLFSPSLVEKGQLPDTTEGCRLRDLIRTPRVVLCVTVTGALGFCVSGTGQADALLASTRLSRPPQAIRAS